MKSFVMIINNFYVNCILRAMYVTQKKKIVTQVIFYTLYVEPDFVKFFSKTLSRTGSSSSPTSSMSRGLPRDKVFSR